MAEIVCFWIEPTGRERISLRRYAHGENCPMTGYHDAWTPIGEDVGSTPSGDTWSHDDPRWPIACACGYAFLDSDHWQCFRDPIYRRVDTGTEMTLRDAPPGAMWNAEWMHTKGPDGLSLVVRCPPPGPEGMGGHDWMPDCAPVDGTPWTRTGTPPKVTAHPSIGILKKDGGYLYHGYLRDGKLIDA